MTHLVGAFEAKNKLSACSMRSSLAARSPSPATASLSPNLFLRPAASIAKRLSAR